MYLRSLLHLIYWQNQENIIIIITIGGTTASWKRTCCTKYNSVMQCSIGDDYK